MSYEIPTLIGSLVDRAIAWEKNLDPAYREAQQRLARAMANVYTSNNPYQRQWVWPPTPPFNHAGVSSPLSGPGPYQGLGGIIGQSQGLAFGYWSFHWNKLPPARKKKRRVLSTNRYL